jgi:hypothetical protein
MLGRTHNNKQTIMRKKIPKLIGLLAAASGLMLAAQADTIQVGDIANLTFASEYNLGHSITVKYNSAAVAQNVTAGTFRLTTGTIQGGGAVQTFYTFCTDINEFFSATKDYELVLSPNSGGITPSTPWATAAPNGFDKASWLYNQQQPNLNAGWLSTANNAAAMQLAVWELLYDSNPGNVAAGLLEVTGLTVAESDAANALVLQATIFFGAGGTFESGTWLKPNLAQGEAAHQGFLYYPVPEPSTIIAGLLLMAPMGMGVARVLRRKQQQSA